MRFVDEFRDPGLATRLTERIRQLATRRWTVMEVCGGQTHSLLRHGIDAELSDVIACIHGPGCPVCVTPAEAIDETVEKALLAGFAKALKGLVAARVEEGERLGAVLLAQVEEIERLAAEAASSASLRPEAVKERLKAQIQELLDAVPTLPEERLAQELALLAAKGDIREELDRLAAHVGQARDMLKEGGAIGRRLDFLSQEFNRESNTLCSKSQDVTLTRIGIQLKTVIDQFREQIQNVE